MNLKNAAIAMTIPKRNTSHFRLAAVCLAFSLLASIKLALASVRAALAPVRVSMRDVPSYWPSVRYLFRFLIVLSLPCLAAVCTTRRSVEQRHGLTATRQLPVHTQTVMLHVVCRPPLAAPEMLACVPPSLVTYFPMALATPVRAAPVDLLTRPKVNPVTAWLRMKLI